MNSMSKAERQAAREKILKALRAGNTRQDAHTYAGVSMTSFYRWLRDDEEFEATPGDLNIAITAPFLI